MVDRGPNTVRESAEVAQRAGFSRKNALGRIGLGVFAGALRAPMILGDFKKLFIYGTSGAVVNMLFENQFGESIQYADLSTGAVGIGCGVALGAASKAVHEVIRVSRTGNPFWDRPRGQ
jgi:hypothetical protein